ncbi:MAG: hypothetical protein U0Z70_20450 [Thermomicrobiales bacterium]
MTRSSLDWLTRTLADGGSRRWAFRKLAAGVLSAGLVSTTSRASQAQAQEQDEMEKLYQSCLRICLSNCTAEGQCSTLDNCAASCSQGFF